MNPLAFTLDTLGYVFFILKPAAIALIAFYCYLRAGGVIRYIRPGITPEELQAFAAAWLILGSGIAMFFMILLSGRM